MARPWKNEWLRVLGYIPMNYRYTPSTLTVYERGMWWVLPAASERTRKHRMRARRMRDQQWQRAHAWVTAFLAESSNRSI